MNTIVMYRNGEAKHGDIFKPDTFPDMQIYFRAWHFRCPEPIEMEDRSMVEGHKIVLRHCTNKWILIIDGQPHMKGVNSMTTANFEVKFSINSFEKAVITVERKKGMSHSYKLVVNETEIQEIKRTVGSLNIGDKPPEHLSIPDTRLFNDGVKDVTLYQIFVKPSNGGQIIAERRFSEFIMLSRLIDALKDQHAGRMPTLPRRVFAPWTDQQSPEFIECRRVALQTYLQTLLANTRVCTYTEFLCFIGLDPRTGDALSEPTSCNLVPSDDDDDEGFPV
jgi:PX domain